MDGTDLNALGNNQVSPFASLNNAVEQFLRSIFIILFIFLAFDPPILIVLLFVLDPIL